MRSKFLREYEIFEYFTSLTDDIVQYDIRRWRFTMETTRANNIANNNNGNSTVLASKIDNGKKIGLTENHVNNRIERCYRIPNNIINGRSTERRGQRVNAGGVSRSCAVLRTTAGETNYSLILVKSKKCTLLAS